MDFLKLKNKRTLLSEVIYIALNVALAFAVLSAIVVSGSVWPAVLLILLSKWRLLAVRPRYWFANIQSNAVDLIASIGLALFMSISQDYLATQIVIMLFYLAWLLALKPRTSPTAMTLQAGFALLVGTSALYTVGYAWPVSAIVILMWVIGYSVTRHVLSAYEEAAITLYSLIAGFIATQLGWLFYHWTIAYSVGTSGAIQLPQAAIVMVMIGLIANSAYQSYKRNERFVFQENILPILLGVSVIFVLLLSFNSAAI